MTDPLRQPHPPAGAPSLASRYARFAGLAVACVGVAALRGWMPTRRLVGDEALPAMAAAVGVALAASLLGTVPIVLARHKPPVEILPAQLGAMAARLLAVLLLALAVGLGFGVALQPFLIWVAIAHAALLFPDVLFARSFVVDRADASPSRVHALSQDPVPSETH